VPRVGDIGWSFATTEGDYVSHMNPAQTREIVRTIMLAAALSLWAAGWAIAGERYLGCWSGGVDGITFVRVRVRVRV